MPPQIGKSDYSGEVREDQQGGFFSKIPLWVWLAAGAVILYALWTKFQGNTGSSSNPLVTASPTDTTPYGNLSAALSEILGNQQAITAQLAAQQQGINTPAGVNVPNTSSSPTITQQPYTATSQANYSKTGGPGTGPDYTKVQAPAAAGTPYVPPISTATITYTPASTRPSWLPSWVKGPLFPATPKPVTFSTPYVSAPALNQANPVTPYGRGN